MELVDTRHSKCRAKASRFESGRGYHPRQPTPPRSRDSIPCGDAWRQYETLASRLEGWLCTDKPKRRTKGRPKLKQRGLGRRHTVALTDSPPAASIATRNAPGTARGHVPWQRCAAERHASTAGGKGRRLLPDRGKAGHCGRRRTCGGPELENQVALSRRNAMATREATLPKTPNPPSKRTPSSPSGASA